MNRSMFQVDSVEGPYNGARDYEEGNMGHRPGVKGGYFPVPPIDSGQDIRSEMLSVMADMGVPVEKHHHEVAPSQHELGMKFGTLLETADNLQLYKYSVHQVAHAYGLSATFLPKPIAGDNGSGMHVHQSLWAGGKPLFAGNGYADLSEAALHYIGGIIKHAKALNAFTNPSTNSYKRLIPGYEAPVLLAYSARNRSASCRIPFVATQMVSVLKCASQMQLLTISCLLSNADGRTRCILTRSTLAMPWIRICTTCPQKNWLKYQQSGVST